MINLISRRARSLITLNRGREYALLRQLLALQPGDYLLDVGSGDGYWTARFAQDCRQVVGLEPDDTLRGYAEQLHNAEKINYSAGIAEEIPFADDTFDKVVSVSSVEHFQNPLLGFREMARVLKPNGRLAISVDSLLPENSTADFRTWHQERHFVTHYFHQSELVAGLNEVGLQVDETQIVHLFRSRLAASLRQIFIRRPRFFLPLFPVFFLLVRVGDRVWDDMHGQIIVVTATKRSQ